MATKKKVEEQEEHYDVSYFQIKKKDLDEAFITKIKLLLESGFRCYVQVSPDDAFLLAASSVDLWLTQLIQILGPENVSLMTGKPTPPPCPPSGCPNP